MIRCFDILIGCNSALIRIRLHSDLVKIRIWPDPEIWDPVHSYRKLLQYKKLVCFCVAVDTAELPVISPVATTGGSSLHTLLVIL